MQTNVRKLRLATDAPLSLHEQADDARWATEARERRRADHRERMRSLLAAAMAVAETSDLLTKEDQLDIREAVDAIVTGAAAFHSITRAARRLQAREEVA